MDFFVECDVPDYDPRFSNNGGSYYQPTYKVTFEDGSHITIEDTSCGDFGDRIFVEAVLSGKVYAAYYGSMVDDECSEFTSEAIPYLEIVRDETGYFIPLISDFCGGDSV